MPYVVTCPKCDARFRSKTQRPEGKGVQCKECGERFFVSAENQEALRNPRRSQYDTASVSRRQTDNDEHCPTSRNRRENQHTVNRSKKMRLLPLLCLTGLFGIVFVGIGSYFLFFSTSSSEYKTRKPRDLPPEMFAYLPASTYRVRYVDCALMRELGDSSVTSEVARVLPEQGILRSTDDVAAICTAKQSLAEQRYFHLIVFFTPQDVDSFATKCNLKQVQTKRGLRYFSGRVGIHEWTVCQPSPTKLVLIQDMPGTYVESEKLDELFARDPDVSRLSALMSAGMHDVSGYPIIEASSELDLVSPMASAGFSGTYAQNEMRETYSIEQFKSPEAAKERLKTLKSIPPSPMASTKVLERERWIKNNRIYKFERLQLTH